MKQNLSKHILFSVGGSLFFSLNALAQDPAFVYDDHGHHDPFMPGVTSVGSLITYDAELSSSDLVIEGIVADNQGNNAAIINGKVVAVGDHVGAYTVDKITVDTVEVSKGDQHVELKVKKGGL